MHFLPPLEVSSSWRVTISLQSLSSYGLLSCRQISLLQKHWWLHWVHWIIQDILPVSRSLITSARSLLSLKVIYSQALGISPSTSLEAIMQPTTGSTDIFGATVILCVRMSCTVRHLTSLEPHSPNGGRNPPSTPMIVTTQNTLNIFPNAPYPRDIVPS